MKKELLVLFLPLLFLNVSYAQAILVAEGFNSIAGVEIASDGKIWVCETGTGNDDGKVSIINSDGSVDIFMEGLPSYFDANNNETQGLWRTYQLPDDKVLLVIGGGEQDSSGSLLTVDKSSFSPGSPLTIGDVESTFNIEDYVLAQGFLESNPYTIAWDDDGHMYIADAAANALLKRDVNTDELSVFAEFPPESNPLPFGPPMIDAVPTKVLAKPGGGFYVSTLTGFPFVNGLAKIYEVDTQGNVSIFKDGYTLLTDMEIDPTDGNLCYLQFAEFGEVDSMLTFLINSAQIVKVLSDGAEEVLADNFGPSPDFAFDSSGDIYATHLFFGQVLKFDFLSAVKEVQAEDIFSHFAPNPFSETSFVNFHLEKPALVTLDIIDVNGQIIHSISEEKGTGEQVFSWDGRMANGKNALSGLYAYQLRIANQQQVGWIYYTSK